MISILRLYFRKVGSPQSFDYKTQNRPEAMEDLLQNGLH